MDATELMIGNWVLHEGEPYQIRQLGIYGVDRDGEDYPAVCVGKPKGIGLIAERNEIEPIPLTPEILEKNGFEEDGNAYIYYTAHYDDYINWCGTILRIGCDNGNMELTDVQYVHELQHALKLCRIDKTIEL